MSSSSEVRSLVRDMWNSIQSGRCEGRSANNCVSEPGRWRTAAASIPAVSTCDLKPRVRTSLAAWCQRACSASQSASGIMSQSRNTRIRCAAARASGVAGSGQSEAEILLVNHLHLQRAVLWGLERRAGAVVDDHHLEQLPRVALALQRRQRQLQRLASLEIGDDDAHRLFRLEALPRRDGQRLPVVAADVGRRRRGCHSISMAASITR